MPNTHSEKQLGRLEISAHLVESSQIAALGYCDGAEVLRVWFKPFKSEGDLSVYDYANVPHATYVNIRHSESIGREFNAAIKKDKERFPYMKLEGDALAWSIADYRREAADVAMLEQGTEAAVIPAEAESESGG